MAGSTEALDVSAPITQDLKYILASNVNVSNFVSVKLSGRINYRIWKAQMLCLIESQLLLHIIDAEKHFPVDKGVHMIGQYDKLVKGWIFGSMSDHVLNNFADLDSAREVWMQLESHFIGVSSNVLDVSRRTEDLKYMLALNVNVSKFVSVKLSGHQNYDVWKTQMLCLIESHNLLDIIHADIRDEGEGDRMTQKYDKLVIGWIFGTMSDRVLKDFQYPSVQLVWRELESTFTNPPIACDREGDSWDAYDVYSPTQELKYARASNVNVSNFVTVKLFGHSNYKIWKAQMLCLIKSQELFHIICAKQTRAANKYDNLVKGWIFGTMNDELVESFRGCYSARFIWTELESSFNPSDNSGIQKNLFYLVETEMASSSNALDVSAPTQDLMFMLASNVNFSNFVTVKFSSQSDYHIWKAQMLCLIDSQMLRGIIDTGFPLPEGMDSNMIKRYDTLIKGWILGSVDERLLGNLVLFESARQLWKELESYVNAQINSSTDDSSLGFMFRAKLASIPEIERTEHIKRKMELYEATVEGRWWKAMSILKNHEDVATKAISENGNTMLHLAVEMRHNFFVEQLLIFLGNGTDVENRNVDGQTALHAAAMVDNKCAAQLLVQKREQLLSILDNKKQSPLDIAYNNLKLNTYVYLLTLSPSYELSRYPDDYTKNAVRLIVTSINRKQYDNALILLQKYPELALKTDQILMAMATAFPTDLGFIESFFYPSLNNVRQKILVNGSLLLDYDISCKCGGDISWVRKIWQNTSYSWLMKIPMILLVPIATLYPLYELICLLILVLRFPISVFYSLLWKVFVITGYPPLKNLERKKKKQNEALKILSLICEQMGTSRSCYNGPIIEAVRKDAYQVVDEILYCSPDTINCQDEQGHNVIQLAIINRAEKVYNLIYHIIERTESYRTMKDSSMNNLVHLAARLAPSFVLGSSTGAALQLQRDSQWCEEVQSLLSPLELKEQNMYMETPAMLFEREHADLIQQGENWAKTTAESSSIIAALNVTVAFAAAITVPGGSNQNSGIPLFKKEFAFSTFGVSNAFSLFTSVTALLLFLSVITTGFSEKVSGLSSPRMLIFGLFTLFLSTTSMMVAFGAILFLVFCNHGPLMLYPLFAFACIPIWLLFLSNSL